MQLASRSSLYSRPNGESVDKLTLIRRTGELFLKHPFYDRRQMACRLLQKSVYETIGQLPEDLDE